MKISIVLHVFASLFFSYTSVAQDRYILPITGFEDPAIEVVYLQEARPLNSEKIGDLKLKKAHYLACDLDNLIAKAKSEAIVKGGNALYITSIKPPTRGKTCYALEADIYKLTEPYKSQPNLFYKHDVSESTDSDDIHILPLFPGGFENMLPFIYNKINYPNSALRDKLGGRIEVSFVVDENGKISKAQVLEGLRWDLDQEVLRAISLMPEWVPGYLNEEAVPVTYTLPIKLYPWLTQ